MDSDGASGSGAVPDNAMSGTRTRSSGCVTVNLSVDVDLFKGQEPEKPGLMERLTVGVG